ncbi:MAG TPA: DUF4926 domain-containing protein [Acidimicrobiales bacterium]|jgi:hypothetical protein
MGRRFELLDVVTLPKGVPDHGVPPGAAVTVVYVYDDGASYEVERVDERGRTIFLGTVTAAEMAALPVE